MHSHLLIVSILYYVSDIVVSVNVEVLQGNLKIVSNSVEDEKDSCHSKVCSSCVDVESVQNFSSSSRVVICDNVEPWLYVAPQIC